uniref:Uncharacterized protein n=1 Tax=Alexandrium catenella TaxID=2925 RepID=A0A7S1RVI5_ALECA
MMNDLGRAFAGSPAAAAMADDLSKKITQEGGKAISNAIAQEIAQERLHLFGIPVDAGPPTPYMMRMRHWMHVILITQAVLCFLRFGVLWDFLGGFWMLLLVGLGWYTWHQEMNITYVSAWGLACLVNGLFDILAAVLPLLFGLLSLQFLKILILGCIPISELFGAAFAWHLYHDFAVNDHMSVPDYDPLGKLFNELDPEETKPFAPKEERGKR